jgi:hypothetical protein
VLRLQRDRERPTQVNPSACHGGAQDQ